MKFFWIIDLEKVSKTIIDFIFKIYQCDSSLILSAVGQKHCFEGWRARLFFSPTSSVFCAWHLTWTCRIQVLFTSNVCNRICTYHLRPKFKFVDRNRVRFRTWHAPNIRLRTGKFQNLNLALETLLRLFCVAMREKNSSDIDKGKTRQNYLIQLHDAKQ